MKNYVQDGEAITVEAPTGGVTSGDGVLLGKLFGVAQTTALATEPVAIVTRGVFTLPKLSAQAWTVGADIYWDAGNDRCTTVSTSNTLIGKATAVAANPSDTGNVRLNA